MKPVQAIALACLCLGGCASPLGRQWVSRGFDQACPAEPSYAAAADANRQSLDTLAWSPFGAPEQGWRVYGPQIAAEIRSPCAPDSSRFAARLSRWQAAHGLDPDGRLTPAAFDAMKVVWQGRRPFVTVRAQGVCPEPPAEASLRAARPEERYAGKQVQLVRPALKAFRRMRAAAAADLAADPDALKLFSGYRSPAYDAERCAREQNCQGVVRAQCSAHRTGAALDLVVGHAPGFTVDASDSANRQFQTGAPAYRWLVANARRFGFANYVFEPWHWEWTGGARR